MPPWFCIWAMKPCTEDDVAMMGKRSSNTARENHARYTGLDRAELILIGKSGACEF